MLNPLGALVITFFVMSFISLVSVIFMFFAKNPKLKNGVFYFLSVWGVVIAYCNVLSIPETWLGEILIAVGLGALSIIGLLVKLCMKGEKKADIARILVAISVVAGMVDCFLI